VAARHGVGAPTAEGSLPRSRQKLTGRGIRQQRGDRDVPWSAPDERQQRAEIASISSAQGSEVAVARVA